MAYDVSKAETAEKAQQEPHWPWSFTSFTTPDSRQSMRAPAVMGVAATRFRNLVVSRTLGACFLKPMYLAKSAPVRSANLFIASWRGEGGW